MSLLSAEARTGSLVLTTLLSTLAVACDSGGTPLLETPLADAGPPCTPGDGGCAPPPLPVPCTPNARVCDGTVARACDPTGERYVFVRDCADWGRPCDEGLCGDACDATDRSAESSFGCEFFAPSLPSSTLESWPAAIGASRFLAEQFDLGLVVVNPGEAPARVQVDRGTIALADVDVAPGALAVLRLPYVSAGVIDGPFGAISLFRRNLAYRVRASSPVGAVLFSPYEQRGTRGALSGSQDASLLLPVGGLGRSYVGVAAATFKPTIDPAYPSYIAIVGVAPEPVAVEVTAPPEITLAPEAADRWPGVGAGETVTLTVSRGDVALFVPDLSQTTEYGADPTGTRVSASAPVAVFGGHMCGPAFGCDHLEDQMPPTPTLGNVFSGGALVDPTLAMESTLRVVAAVDTTEVTLRAGDASETVTLAPGAWVEREVSSTWRVETSLPALVALYTQTEAPPRGYLGGPSLVVVPPIAQTLASYTFVVPATYDRRFGSRAFVRVDRAPGQEIRLDGAPIVAEWQAQGDRESASVPVLEGVHVLESDLRFGAIAFGIGEAVSYATPLGLVLTPLR